MNHSSCLDVITDSKTGAYDKISFTWNVSWTYIFSCFLNEGFDFVLFRNCWLTHTHTHWSVAHFQGLGLCKFPGSPVSVFTGSSGSLPWPLSFCATCFICIMHIHENTHVQIVFLISSYWKWISQIHLIHSGRTIKTLRGSYCTVKWCNSSPHRSIWQTKCKLWIMSFSWNSLYWIMMI